MRLKTSLDQAIVTMESAFGVARLVPTPFPHFALPDLFDAETAMAALRWLEEDAPWVVRSRRFYIYHGCAKVADRISDSPAAVIAAPKTFQCMRRHLERIFGVKLSSSRFDLSAHRALPGHRLGVHTDCPSHGTETHRLLINLNSGFDDEQGGHLILLNPHDTVENTVILRPLHNSAVAMEFSDHSWHCVDEIRTGKRYSLVYSFWTESSVSRPDESDASGTITDETPGISEQEFRELTGLLREIGAGAVPHNARYLIEHLQGTGRLLKKWQCDGDVCKAGLFHSIFGRPSFPHSLVGEEDIDIIRAAVGERTLFLAQLFSRMDWPSILELLTDGNLLEAGKSVALNSNDLQALVSLQWATILEQSPYLPHSTGECAQLRELYKQTCQFLPARAHEDLRKMLALD